MTRLTHKTLKSILVLSTGLAILAVLPAPIPSEAMAQTKAQTQTHTQAQTQAAARSLSPAQVRDDVALARGAYEDIHPGYTRFADKAELDAAWDGIVARAEAQGSLSESEFYLAVSETLALIRCDHTKAELSRAMKKNRKTAPVYLPLRWTVVENRAVILDAPDGGPVMAGDEILSIDGRTVAELQAALHRYIPVDGYNDHVREEGMAASLELMGGAVDHFGALLWDVPAQAVLELESADGQRRTATLDRVGHDDWTAINVSDSGLNFPDSVSLTPVGSRGAVLRIDTFVNYRNPVDPDTIYAPIFERLRAEGRDRLVLDLRRNGGGSTDASQGLFAYLIDAPRRLSTAQIMRTLDHSAYEDHISTWDKRAINPNRLGFRKTETGEYALRGRFSDDTDRIKPARGAFDGELTVLTGRSNSSASTTLISGLRAARDVTLIGERTGGNPAGPTAGSIFFLKLPESGLTLRLPIFRYVNNSGDVVDGVGLDPDIDAPTTVESLRAGTDPALDAAIARMRD
ncbi:MAG: S41 family peptidase [Litorimonas sp.]